MLFFRTLQRQAIEKTVSNLRSEFLIFEIRYNQVLQADTPTPSPLINKDPIVRKRYKELALLLHPDRASDLEDKNNRMALMGLAGEALMNNDLNRLEELLNRYRPQVQSKQQRVESLEFQIYHLYIERQKILGSSLWELYELEQEWAAQGRDLLSYLSKEQT